LLIRFFDDLAACSAFCVLKKLKLPAPLVFAAYHQRFSAGVAFVAAHESLPAADGAGCDKRPAAAGACGVAAHYRFEASWALKAKGRAAAAFGAQAGVPLYHFSAMDTWLLVSGQMLSSPQFGAAPTQRKKIMTPFQE